MPAIYVPMYPKTVAVSGVAANFSPIVQATYITLQVTCDSFFRVSKAGTAATADGNACHFIAAGQPCDIAVPMGSIVSVIANTGGSGAAYISEWI